MSFPRNVRGFTLVELLVVVAIMALLISILLPSLSQARETARQIKCQSIMKQMGTANTNYSVNFANWWIPLTVPHEEAGEGFYRWFNNPEFKYQMDMANRPIPGDTQDEWNAPLGMICPNADAVRENPYAEVAGTDRYEDRYSFRRSYGINLRGLPSWSVRFEKPRGYFLPDVHEASAKLAYTDSLYDGTQAQYALEYAAIGETENATTEGWHVPASRHHFMGDPDRDRINLLYLDGHAGSLTTSELIASPQEDLWNPYQRR